MNPLYYAAKPVTMARRSGSGALDDLGGVADDLFGWLFDFVLKAVAYTSPVWIPWLMVKEMFAMWHPVAATAAAIPLVGAFIIVAGWAWGLSSDTDAEEPQPEHSRITTMEDIDKALGR